jgi:hypothetical protein
MAALGGLVERGKFVVTFFGVIAAFVSACGYWGAAAFSPALLLTLVSVPVALLCAAYGARKTVVVAVYFGVTAWLPHWTDVGSTFRFGQAWFLLFGLGLLLALIMSLWHSLNVRAT